MKVLILEDEPRAANRLARLIVQIDPNIELLAKIGSVEEAVSWLENNESPDLIFMDVRLSDGDCFNIFDSIVVESPIVFSTAYSEYALRAFAVNSIDYLLKPIVKQDLERALLKYRNLAGYRMAPTAWPDFKAEPSPYKQQFLIAIGGRFIPVKSNSIVAIRSYLKAVQLVDEAGTEWLLDQSLSEVEAVLDPSVYFRVSRQWLIRLSDVHELRRDGSGYSIQLANLSQTIKVSRAKVSALKKRLAGKD